MSNAKSNKNSVKAAAVTPTVESAVETQTETVASAVDTTVSSKLRIEVLSDKIASFGLNDEEKKLRDDIIADITEAENFTMQSFYAYLRVGRKLVAAKAKLMGKKGRYSKFLESIGLNIRKAQRYIQVATHSRFANMDENEIKSLHHITQTKLIEMITLSDDDFYAIVNNSDYKFPKKPNGDIEIPSDIIIDKVLYKTLMSKDKKYILNEYNSLLIKRNQLEAELNLLKVSDAENLKAINTTSENVYLPSTEAEVA